MTPSIPKSTFLTSTKWRLDTGYCNVSPENDSINTWRTIPVEITWYSQLQYRTKWTLRHTESWVSARPQTTTTAYPCIPYGLADLATKWINMAMFYTELWRIYVPKNTIDLQTPLSLLLSGGHVCEASSRLGRPRNEKCIIMPYYASLLCSNLSLILNGKSCLSFSCALHAI